MLRNINYVFYILILLVNLHCSSNKVDKDAEDNTRLLLENSLNKLKGPNMSLDSILFKFYQIENELSRKLDNESFAEFNNQAGLIFYSRSEIELALSCFKKAEVLYSNAGLPKQASRMISNQAVILELKGNYKEAANLYLEALKSFNDSIADDRKAIAYIYNNLGVLYEEMGIMENAVFHYKKALTIKKELNDTLGIASTLNNIGVVFDEMYKIPDSALKYYTESYNIYQHMGSVDNLAKAGNNLGRLYADLRKYKESYQFLSKSLLIYDSINNLSGKSDVLRNLGKYYFLSGENTKAIIALKEALRISDSLANIKNSLDIIELLSKVYLTSGKQNNAIEVLQRYNVLHDSIYNIENQKTILELESKYQLNKKNETIEMFRLKDELNNKKIRNQTLLILFLVLIFVIILSVFYFYNVKSRYKYRQMNLELQNYLFKCRNLESKLEDQKEIKENQQAENFEKYELSPRESEVLLLISKGYRNQEIAQQLFVSQNTIKTHIKNIYNKLDVKNRVEALKKVEILPADAK